MNSYLYRMALIINWSRTDRKIVKITLFTLSFVFKNLHIFPSESGRCCSVIPFERLNKIPRGWKTGTFCSLFNTQAASWQQMFGKFHAAFEQILSRGLPVHLFPVPEKSSQRHTPLFCQYPAVKFFIQMAFHEYSDLMYFFMSRLNLGCFAALKNDFWYQS